MDFGTSVQHASKRVEGTGDRGWAEGLRLFTSRNDDCLWPNAGDEGSRHWFRGGHRQEDGGHAGPPTTLRMRLIFLLFLTACEHVNCTINKYSAFSTKVYAQCDTLSGGQARLVPNSFFMVA
jgi:hypothetical protein